MKKGIGPNNLGAPKGVGKQVGDFVKDVAKAIGLGGAAAVAEKIAKKKINPKKQITTGRPNKSIKPTVKQQAQIKEKIAKAEVKGKTIYNVPKTEQLSKKKSQLKRPKVDPGREGVFGPYEGQTFGYQKLTTAKPKSDAQLQKITPAKPKPKPKKVKIKVKPNKTKIKIKN